MTDPLANLQGETDHTILLVIATEMRHLRNDAEEKHKRTHNAIDKLAGEVGLQNGRINSLERWRWIITGGISLLVVLWPLLVFEFRQAIVHALGG